jgi:hypothetical protein
MTPHALKTHVGSGWTPESRATTAAAGHTIMASGLEGKHEDKLHDDSGIDHLSEEFIAAADELIGEAFGLCPPPG